MHEKMINAIKKQGGARKGSGRPKLNKVQLCIYMLPEHAQIIKDRAAFEHLTIGEYIEKHLTY